MTTHSSEQAPASLRYLAIAGEIVQRIAATQQENIEAAAQICAETIANDGLVFCWGGDALHDFAGNGQIAQRGRLLFG